MSVMLTPLFILKIKEICDAMQRKKAALIDRVKTLRPRATFFSLTQVPLDSLAEWPAQD
jgi:hypothetical protein